VADEHKGPDSSIDPSLRRMPPGYDSTGDPVVGNPYPPSHPLHALWARVTRDAEQKVARLKSEWLRLQETEFSQTPESIEAMEAFNDRFWAKRREVVCSEFEIWAARGAQMMFSDADVRAMDKWLVAFAEGLLDLNAQHMEKYDLPRRLIEPRLRELRQDLAAVVLHWKAETRRVCDIRQAEQEARETDNTSTAPATPHRAAAANQFPKRAQWLRQALEARKWTVQDFERFGGPNAKTSRKVLAGADVRETVLEKIAQGLSVKGKSVTRSNIPDD
jgi:hypothetical protein